MTIFSSFCYDFIKLCFLPFGRVLPQPRIRFILFKLRTLDLLCICIIHFRCCLPLFLCFSSLAQNLAASIGFCFLYSYCVPLMLDDTIDVLGPSSFIFFLLFFSFRFAFTPTHHSSSSYLNILNISSKQTSIFPRQL